MKRHSSSLWRTLIAFLLLDTWKELEVIVQLIMNLIVVQYLVMIFFQIYILAIIVIKRIAVPLAMAISVHITFIPNTNHHYLLIKTSNMKRTAFQCWIMKFTPSNIEFFFLLYLFVVLLNLSSFFEFHKIKNLHFQKSSFSFFIILTSMDSDDSDSADIPIEQLLYS